VQEVGTITEAHIWITFIAVFASVIGSLAVAFIGLGKMKQQIESHELLDKERHENIQEMFKEIRSILLKK
jgi:hypothetical protein